MLKNKAQAVPTIMWKVAEPSHLTKERIRKIVMRMSITIFVFLLLINVTPINIV